MNIVRLNVNADNEETAEKTMVIRKEFPLRDNVDQKDVGYVLSAKFRICKFYLKKKKNVRKFFSKYK